MRRIRTIALSFAALGLLAMSTACTTTHKETNGYYHRRGSIHNESFPPNYVPGRHRSYGSYGHYGRW